MPPKPKSFIFGHLVKVRREAKLLSQEHFAGLLHIKPARLRKIEKSPQIPVEESLIDRIIERLDLDVHDQRLLRFTELCFPDAVSLGDINFDFIYATEKPTLFPSKPPGFHEDGPIERRVGGTAVSFARAARRAGFRRSTVVGSIGRDFLGVAIRYSLRAEGLECLLEEQKGMESGVSVILRHPSGAHRDVALTVTDSCRKLPPRKNINRLVTDGTLLFMSGYCLIHSNHSGGRPHIHDEQFAEAMALLADASVKAAMVGFDVTVDFDRAMTYRHFVRSLQGKLNILVAEIATVSRWHKRKEKESDDSYVRGRVSPKVMDDLGLDVLLLRDSTYQIEYRCVRGSVVEGPLPFPRKPIRERVGLADQRTADFLIKHLVDRQMHNE